MDQLQAYANPMSMAIAFLYLDTAGNNYYSMSQQDYVPFKQGLKTWLFSGY